MTEPIEVPGNPGIGEPGVPEPYPGPGEADLPGPPSEPEPYPPPDEADLPQPAQI